MAGKNFTPRAHASSPWESLINACDQASASEGTAGYKAAHGPKYSVRPDLSVNRSKSKHLVDKGYYRSQATCSQSQIRTGAVGAAQGLSGENLGRLLASSLESDQHNEQHQQQNHLIGDSSQYVDRPSMSASSRQMHSKQSWRQQCTATTEQEQQQLQHRVEERAETNCNIKSSISPTLSDWSVPAAGSLQFEPELPTSWLCSRPRSSRSSGSQLQRPTQQQPHPLQLTVPQLAAAQNHAPKPNTVHNSAAAPPAKGHFWQTRGDFTVMDALSTPALIQQATRKEGTRLTASVEDHQGCSPQDTTCRWVASGPLAINPTTAAAAAAAALVFESPVPGDSADLWSSETHDRCGTPHSELVRRPPQGFHSTKHMVSAQAGATSSSTVGGCSSPFEVALLQNHAGNCSWSGHGRQADAHHVAAPHSTGPWIRHNPECWGAAFSSHIHRPIPMLPGTAVAWTQTDTRAAHPAAVNPAQPLHPVLQAHMQKLSTLQAQPQNFTAKQLAGGWVSSDGADSQARQKPLARDSLFDSQAAALPQQSANGLKLLGPFMQAGVDSTQHSAMISAQNLLGQLGGSAMQPAWLLERMQATTEPSVCAPPSETNHMPPQGTHVWQAGAEHNSVATGSNHTAAVCSHTTARIELLRQLQQYNQCQQQRELQEQQETLQLLQQQLRQQVRQHEAATLQLQLQLSLLHDSTMAAETSGNLASPRPAAASTASDPAAQLACSSRDVSDPSEQLLLRLLQQPAWEQVQQQMRGQQSCEQPPSEQRLREKRVRPQQPQKKPRYKRTREQLQSECEQPDVDTQADCTETPVCSEFRFEVSPSGSSSNGGGRGCISPAGFLLLAPARELSSKQQALLSRILTGSSPA